jgi:hypothetical protein
MFVENHGLFSIISEIDIVHVPYSINQPLKLGFGCLNHGTTYMHAGLNVAIAP